MSLVVWLPLCGDINNQGLLDVKTSGNPNFTSDGKIGKCLTCAGDYKCVYTTDSDSLKYMNNFSFCMWIKSNYTSGQQYAFSYGRVDYNSYGYGVQAISNAIRLWYGRHYIDLSPCENGIWYHVALTLSDGTLKTYLNGNLFTTITVSNYPLYTETAGIGIGCFHYNGGNLYPFSGNLNDFRIYNHCLSPREVKEISKGLVCNYPLNDLYCTNSINKYKGDNAEGKYNDKSSAITCTKLENERGYNYKFTYTGTGTNTWLLMHFPYFSFTPGKIYDYSCKVRANSWSNANFWMRTARMNNDWDKQVAQVLTKKGEWVEYHYQIQLDKTSVRSGETCTTNPVLEFYTNSLVAKDTVYSMDIDIKDAQIAEVSTNSKVPFTDGNYPDTTVYDCSGYRNNGTINNGNYVSCNSDSPRYDTCYKLVNGASPYITTPNFSFENMTQGTVSIWINRHSTDSTWRNYLMFANGYNWTANTMDFIIFGSTGGQVITMDCCSNRYDFTPDLNKWYLYTLTWDFSTKTAKFYVNGDLMKTITQDRIGSTDYTTKHGIHFVGNQYYTTSDYSISDFRLYSTALSATDVKELYNTPISLTNTGVLMTQGEFKEV